MPEDLFESYSDYSEGVAFEERAREHAAEQAEIETLATITREEPVATDEDIYDFRNDGATALPLIKARIDRLVSVLGDFKRQRHPEIDRQSYLRRLHEDLELYYGYNEDLITVLLKLFGPDECVEYLEASEVSRPLTIRANTLRTKRRDLAQALIARGVNINPVGEWCSSGLQVFESQISLGATPEYLTGLYMIQSASSFIPVEVLDPKPNMRVADLCSAPGGKTTHIAMKMKNTGVLYANDVSKTRITSVLANCHRLGVRNVIVSVSDAREFAVSGLDAILLDAPCTGLGVVSSDPSIKIQKSYKDIVRSAALQKDLILHALDLLKVGGTLVYSTCSIAVEENEAVVDYALRRCGKAIEVVDFSAQIPFGAQGIRSFGENRFHPAVQNTRRVYPHQHNLDGFYIAKIVKKAAIPADANRRKANEAAVRQEREAARASRRPESSAAATGTHYRAGDEDAGLFERDNIPAVDPARIAELACVARPADSDSESDSEMPEHVRSKIERVRARQAEFERRKAARKEEHAAGDN